MGDRTPQEAAKCLTEDDPSCRTRSATSTSGANTAVPATNNFPQTNAPFNAGSTPVPGAPQDQPDIPSASATSIINPSAAAVTPVSSTSSTGSSKGLNNGAIAGIAIGCLIAGALVALVASFLVFKKRTKHHHSQNASPAAYNNTYSDSTPEFVMMPQKPPGRHSPYLQVSQTPLPTAAPIAAPAPAPVRQVDDQLAFLPAVAHESDIQHRIAALFAAVQRHVDTYYRHVQASITPSMTPELARFGAAGVDMAEVLQDCSSATAAIGHALMAYVLGITAPRGGRGRCGRKKFSCTRLFFYTCFSRFLVEMRLLTYFTDQTLASATLLLRRLAVYIYTQSHQATPLRHSRTSTLSSIREAAELFSLTFFPWANPASDDDAKEEHLARVIADALETRIWLFAQPGEYVFRWEGVGARGVVVVSPEVVVVQGDGRGERVVVERRVVGV